jgi:serpin B
MRSRPSIALLSTLSLSACISAPPAGKTTAEPIATHAAIPETERPADPPNVAEARAFANASNAFGYDLYAQLASGNDNLIYSPASVSMALAMTWAGARGETRDEMAKVLHLDGDPKTLSTSAGKLLSVLDAPHDAYTLRVANRLFGEQTLPFDPAFVAVTRNDFGAELTKMDFKHAFEPARVDINTWVAKETHDKIQNLLPDGSLDEKTRLVLVDAVYLHADWESPFAKEATRPNPFHAPNGTTEPPTMHGEKVLGYADDDGVRVLEMPYKGGDLSMTVLLPDDASNLGALEAKIEHGGLDGFLAKEQSKRVAVSLPKFTIEMSSAVRLGSMLAAMGMPRAFQDGPADLSGMVDPAAPSDDRSRLSVSDVFHKAFVAVDELGTEAAAATAVVIAGRAVVQADAEFTADHPFLFAIRDTKTGLVLFVGRVERPA